MNREEDIMVILVHQDDGDLDDKANTGVIRTMALSINRDMKEVVPLNNGED